MKKHPNEYAFIITNKSSTILLDCSIILKSGIGSEIIKPSDKFFQKTRRTGLYNIQSIDNMPSIINYGLLSNEKAQQIPHTSIAMNEIQERREPIRIPNGLKLHQYANLYCDYWNPMLSRKRAQNEDICILKFSTTVLDLDGVIVSDRNASSDYAAFYPAENGLEYIDFDLVFAKYWTDPDHYEMCRRKSIKCAEVLVPFSISFDYVLYAVVFSKEAAEKLRNSGFSRDIIVESRAFFRS